MEIEMTWVEEYSVINWDNFKPLSLEHPKTFFSPYQIWWINIQDLQRN